MTALLREVWIQPVHGGFGEFNTTRDDSTETFLSIHDMFPSAEQIIDLDDESDLPEGAEDIRGRIHDEPDHVYVVVDGDRWWYVGADEVDEE